MSHSHQRRTSLKGTPSSQASFFIDIEKAEGVLIDGDKKNDDIPEYKRSSLLQDMVVVLVLLIFAGGSMTLGWKYGTSLLSGAVSRPAAETANPILNMNDDSNEKQLLSEWEASLSDSKILDTTTDFPEDEERSTFNSQSDLKEIFSVSPIILLSNDPESPNQQKLESIIRNLNIHPEPKVVSLDKHPNCKSILNYLKSYELHQDTGYTTTTSTMEGKIKSDLKYNQANSDDEDEEDAYHVDYEALKYSTEKEIAEAGALHNIPRLFIGGVPYGNYNQLFKKYRNKSLAQFVKEKGKGLITVG